MSVRRRAGERRHAADFHAAASRMYAASRPRGASCEVAAGVRCLSGSRFNRTWIDPFSSAMWFDGWAAKIRIDTPWLHALAREERPTVDATTWLLSTGWKKLHGPLRVDDRPR